LGPLAPVLDALALGQGLAEDELDLSIDAAQLVVGPFLDGVEDGGVDTKKKGLPFSHGVTTSRQVRG
jgi:hypothetical protein